MHRLSLPRPDLGVAGRSTPAESKMADADAPPPVPDKDAEAQANEDLRQATMVRRRAELIPGNHRVLRRRST